MDKPTPFSKVFFEISGYCQARCPYCCTGNRSLKSYPARFIPVKEFERGLQYLLENGLADKFTRFDLYNWGDPFLHPKFQDILRILSSKKTKYRLSTNAGIYRKIPSGLQEGLTRLTITIPGFSQTSYNRVHRLPFEKVKMNIQRFADDLGPERLYITFLVFQFNLNEIWEAYSFFEKHGIQVHFTVAYLNGYTMSRKFLLGNMTVPNIKEIGRDLFLFYIEDLISSRPKKYVCPQFSILALDEFCNVLTCCVVTKDHPDYNIGQLFNLRAEDIYNKKLNRSVCKECQHLGIDFWVQTPPDLSFLNRITGEGFSAREILKIITLKIKKKLKKIRKIEN